MTATTPAGPHHPATVPAAVLRRAETDPDRPALVDRHGIHTYGQFLADAAALAAALRPHLGGPEPVVAVLQPRTAAVAVAQFAVWLTGAAFLPLDPALPPARIAQVLTEARCALAVAAPELADRLPAEVTVVHDGVDVLAGAADAGGSTLAGPDAPAYLISTSGSTGRPRQVEVAHDGLWRVLDWYGKYFRLGPEVRVAAFAGLAFDASLLDLWAPLVRGATVVVVEEEAVREPERIAENLRQVDHAFLATPLTEQLLRGGTDTGRLRSLATGGDRLRVWPPEGFGAAVHNLYGPTEATILVTATGDLRRYADRSVPPPIGRPVAGARLDLVPTDAADDAGVPDDGTAGGDAGTPAGDAGELHITGPLLARGYRDAPEATAAAFVPGPDGRRYRTGDLCRRDADGELHFLGRVDGQVKIRGNRIELREVEYALLGVPGVTQAVAGVTQRDGESVLAAWVAGDVDPGGVRGWLRERLPAAMVPHLVDVRDALPLTANGKLDRRALREAAVPAPACGSAPDSAPAAVAEQAPGAVPAAGRVADAVVAAWRAVLGATPDPDDDFFGAGGDSLLAVRLSARVRQLLGVDVRAALLYEHRRFGDYLAAVEELHGPEATDGVGAPR